MILRPLPLMWAAAAVLTAYGFIRDPGPVPAQTPIISGVPFVVDGDTIVVNEIHIRLFGIDAPESAQRCTDQDGDDYRCGLLATSLLEEEIAGRSVDCTPIDTDHYGRTVAICAVGNIDLGRFMVERGMAVDEDDAVEGPARQQAPRHQLAQPPYVGLGLDHPHAFRRRVLPHVLRGGHGEGGDAC